MRNRVIPAFQELESRELLSTTQSGYARQAEVKHLYDVYLSFLQNLEFHSTATPAQYVNLRDDSLAISQAASTTNLAPKVADRKTADASVQIDRAFIEGGLNEQGWDTVHTRLNATLNGLNVPEPLISQTIADKRAVGVSAGVNAVAYTDLNNNAERLHLAELNLAGGYGHFTDPQLYYTQHLRGFIRGGAIAKNAAKATLEADLAALTSNNLAVRQEVNSLEKIGSNVSTDAFATVISDYKVANTSSDALAQLNSSIRATVGLINKPTSNAIDKLDPAVLFSAAGTQANADKILTDIEKYVAAGASTPLNPFRVQILR